MDANTLIFVVAGLLFLAIFSVGYSFLRRSPKIRQRIQDVDQPVGIESPAGGATEKMEGVLEPLGKMVPGRSTEDLKKERRKLISAGFRRKNAVAIFYGSRVVTAVAFWVILGVVGMPLNNPVLYLVLPILLGMILPDIWLKLRISQRKENIQLALPDMMDLAVVCVEAGMGLDQSLQRISEELKNAHPDLSEELYIYNLETNAGLPRAQAMRNLASRTNVDDVKSLSGTLIQADRFGTSIAQSLRVFSDTLRTKRRQRAEEKAAKLNIKIIVPLVLFIFPSIFVVVAGPAIIMMIRNLLPLLAGTD
jgi:tight adherence protein C